MRRRKLLAGPGSLAAGGAAVMGTGAFSQATLEGRGVNASAVADEDSFAALLADDSGLLNDEYDIGAGEGKLQLAFNGDSEVQTGNFLGEGQGLSTDSEYFFDGVFGVANKAEGQIGGNGNNYRVFVDWSGLDNPDNFVFYSTLVGGRPSSVNPSGTYRFGGGDVPSGSYINVGVGIDTTDADLGSGWETGTIEVEFTDNP
jgi:hypothetical protein